MAIIPQEWHGLTGAQIRDIMIGILQRAENAADAVETIDGTFVFGYYREQEPGPNYFVDSNEVALDPKEGVIYYDLDNLPNAYSYSDKEKKYVYLSTDAESFNEILNRLNNFNESQKNIETIVNNKVDKDGNKKLSTNDYDDTEKNKIRIINKLSDLEETPKQGQLFSKNSDEADPDSGVIYPAGLYIYTGEQKQPFQRVGGLL